MKIYIVKYHDEGREIEKGFRDRGEAESLRKIKKGKIRSIDVQMKIKIIV